MYDKLTPLTIDRSLYDKSNKVEYSAAMKKEKKMADIETLLLQKVYLITNYERYKFSPDLIKFLCNQVELLVSKQDGLDKKQIVISIMTQTFNLNAQEQQLIEELIQFIWEHKLIIKKGIFNFSECFKKILISFVRKILILTIAQQVVNHTPVYKTELTVMLKVLTTLGTQHKVALLVLAFLL
jgi:hypothetical protein